MSATGTIGMQGPNLSKSRLPIPSGKIAEFCKRW
jgi:hypothetical protein